MGNIKGVLCPDWLLSGQAGPNCMLRIARFDPAQEKCCVERTYQASNFWTMSVTESQRWQKTDSSQPRSFFLFCCFIKGQKELVQYPAILTSR